jgi:hypothetical protein
MLKKGTEDKNHNNEDKSYTVCSKLLTYIQEDYEASGVVVYV